MKDYNKESLQMHEEKRGKLEIHSKVPVNTQEDLSRAYTPGVAEPVRRIAEDPEEAYRYTIKGNSVAVVTDGSAVLGLGNVGPEAALPVMEGKAVLFREFAGIDAYPICLDTQDTDEIVETVRRIAPGFGGINLEDISAPRCFEIEARLQDLGIPVFHDDQHGTAIVLLAGLINAAKVVKKDISDLRVVISGAGAAGVAVAKLLTCHDDESGVCEAVRDVVVVDSTGIISSERGDLSDVKRDLASYTNSRGMTGGLQEALREADVFVGVSVPGILSKDMVRSMADNPVIFALANPDPEILPDDAYDAGAAVVATGRSDFSNQVNNVLAFPGIFRGALDMRAPRITGTMKVKAAYALAELVPTPTAEKILPSVIDTSVVPAIATAVRENGEI
ncbi:MAG: NADP-dependent malic enzyme [Candidatus Paceibacterota bacterium]